MAIGFNLPGIPGQIRGTAEEAGAVPDLGQAMMQGFRSNLENIQGYPRQLAQQLLSNQLANKIKSVEAQYAEPMAKTGYEKALMELKYLPQEKQAALGLQSLKRQMLEKQMQQQALDMQLRQQFVNALSNQQQPTIESSRQYGAQQPETRLQQPAFQGTPFRLPEQMPKPKLATQVLQGMAEPNAKVIQAGNPNLYHLDTVYDKNPLFRPYFKNYNLEKNVKVSTNPQTNETIIQTTYPSGKITAEAVQVGKTPEEIEFSKSMAKSRAKFLDEAAPSIMNLEESQSNLDEIANLLNSKAESINVIGRMNKPFTELFGNQEQQDILGRLKTQTGTIMMDAAKNIKGAFTGRDMNFVNDMKPNPGEPFYMFVAKTAAMQASNRLALDRINLMTDLIERGTMPAKAAKIAAQKTPFEPIMRHYQEQLETAKQRTTSKVKSTPEQNAYVKSLSDSELMSMISQGG